MDNSPPKAPSRILSPVDFSPRSTEGVEYAGMLAQTFNASVVLHCNVNLPERSFLEDAKPSADATIEQQAHEMLTQWANDFLLDVETSICVSRDEFPADGVLRMALEQAVDLIVIASHGRTGLSRWVMGSVAEKVARSADVPVLVVPSHDQIE